MVEELMRYLSCLCMIRINNPKQEVTEDNNDDNASRRPSVPCIYIVDAQNNTKLLDIPPVQFRRYSI